MVRPIFAGAALAAVVGTTQAGSLLQKVQHAAEVPLSALELPAVHGGIVEFAACSGCETRAAATSSSTSYLINNRAATFDAFAAAVETARAAADVAKRSLVGLYFDAESRRLVRIALVAPLSQ